MSEYIEIDKEEAVQSRTYGFRTVIENPQYISLWVVGLSSTTIRWLETPAIGIFVYQMTESAMWVALVGFLRMIPMLIFGPVIGMISDRINRKKILLMGSIFMIFLYLFLAYLSIVGALNIWHICVGVFFAGIIWAGDNPVRRALMAEVVGQKHITIGLGIDMGTSNFGRVIGPIGAGVVIALVGINGSYLTGVLMFFFATIAIIFISNNNPTFDSQKSVESQKPLSIMNTIKSGMSLVAGSQILMATMIITVIMNLFAFPYQHMVPVIGSEVYGIGPVFIGILLSVEGLGAMLGSLVIALKSNHLYNTRIFFFGALIYIVSIGLFGLLNNYWIILPLMFLGGFGLAGFSTMQTIIILNSSPVNKRGSVLGVLSAAIGTGPFGVLQIGLFAAIIGAQFSVFMSAFIGLVLITSTLLLTRKFLTTETFATTVKRN